MTARLEVDVAAICRSMAAAAAAPTLSERSIRAMEKRMQSRTVERYDLDDVVAELGIDEDDQ